MGAACRCILSYKQGDWLNIIIEYQRAAPHLEWYGSLGMDCVLYVIVTKTLIGVHGRMHPN